MTDPYVYPGTKVLINKFDIRDYNELCKIEKKLTSQRLEEPIPKGNFNLSHLCAIHHHIFQDVYDWAGKIRTVEISKETQFMPLRYIEGGFLDIHKRLEDSNFLKNLTADNFAKKGAVIIGDINHVHPFREGNGRTQTTYFIQLAEKAGHDFDIRCISKSLWIEASKTSHFGKYELMEQAIKMGITPARTIKKDKSQDR